MPQSKNKENLSKIRHEIDSCLLALDIIRDEFKEAPPRPEQLEEFESYLKKLNSFWGKYKEVTR